MGEPSAVAADRFAELRADAVAGHDELVRAHARRGRRLEEAARAQRAELLDVREVRPLRALRVRLADLGGEVCSESVEASPQGLGKTARRG